MDNLNAARWFAPQPLLSARHPQSHCGYDRQDGLALAIKRITSIGERTQSTHGRTRGRSKRDLIQKTRTEYPNQTTSIITSLSPWAGRFERHNLGHVRLESNRKY
jgi:hypothetical protein